MTFEDFIIELFCWIGDVINDLPNMRKPGLHRVVGCCLMINDVRIKHKKTPLLNHGDSLPAIRLLGINR